MESVKLRTWVEERKSEMKSILASLTKISQDILTNPVKEYGPSNYSLTRQNSLPVQMMPTTMNLDLVSNDTVLNTLIHRTNNGSVDRKP